MVYMNNTIKVSSCTNFRGVENVSKPCELHKKAECKSEYIDLSNTYTQENIIDILREAGTYNKPVYPCTYSIAYYPNSESLVISNTNMTNDVTEINKDGTVRHCGSWHNKEVAQGEKYTAIVNDALERIDVLD